MLPQAATDFYARQQRVNATAANEVKRAWRRMGDDFDASWRRVAPAVLATLVEAQTRNVLAARDYVPRVLDETGIPDRPEGDFQPGSLVGRACRNRPPTRSPCTYSWKRDGSCSDWWKYPFSALASESPSSATMLW